MPRKQIGKKTATRKKSPRSKTARAKSAVKRTVKKAAKNVQSNVERARDLAAALIRAGEMLEQGAALLDSMAERGTTAARRKRSDRSTKT